MAKLVVAEKPSVAKAIANVLGAKDKKAGYYEGAGFLVSWCVGHLISFATPDAYDEKYAKWRIEDLPIIPDKWKYITSPKTKKQLSVLKDLFKRSDVTAVINACDAGREGELIFREVYEYFNCKKPIERLWISSMEESAILEGFNALRNGKDHDNLYQSALCRSQADWLIGMNYSRLYSSMYNTNLSLGRVQTPTLTMIVERELKIQNFVKEPFYTIELDGCGFVATSEKIKDKTEAEAIKDRCNGKIAVIKSVEEKKKELSAPKLYDLTTLQREANRMFGYPASQTLNCAQNLYEQKILTYPRTDSRFLTEDMADGMPELVTSICEILSFSVPDDEDDTINVSVVVNNAKVSDHHAIIPTLHASNISIDSLPTAEKNILMMVCTRLIAAVDAKHIYAETVVTVDCDGEIFKTKGKTILKNGWKSIEEAFNVNFGKKRLQNDEKNLPEVSEGQKFEVIASTREGFTQPPKQFTEDILLSAMENAGVEDMPEDAERKGIGTSATRADTIETLIKKEYIKRKEKILIPTEKGYSLVKVLPDEDSIKSPILTAEWEQKLKNIEHGELAAKDFIKAIGDYVRGMIKANSTASEENKALFPSNNSTGAVVGECPRCGGNVAETAKTFSCENVWNKTCGFALWKDNRYFALKKKTITTEVAIALLKEGRIFMSGLHSEKTGKKYNATIFMDDVAEEGGNMRTSFRMEFEKK